MYEDFIFRLLSFQYRASGYLRDFYRESGRPGDAALPVLLHLPPALRTAEHKSTDKLYPNQAKKKTGNWGEKTLAFRKPF